MVDEHFIPSKYRHYTFYTILPVPTLLQELSLPVIVMVKRLVKDATNKTSGNKNSKINSLLSVLLQKLEANGHWIEERRAKVDFAPNNRAGVDSFLKGFEWEKTPLGAFVQGQRKQREQKAKLIEASRRQEDQKRKAERENRDKDDKESMADIVQSSDDEHFNEDDSE